MKLNVEKCSLGAYKTYEKNGRKKVFHATTLMNELKFI